MQDGVGGGHRSGRALVKLRIGADDKTRIVSSAGWCKDVVTLMPEWCIFLKRSTKLLDAGFADMSLDQYRTAQIGR